MGWDEKGIWRRKIYDIKTFLFCFLIQKSWDAEMNGGKGRKEGRKEERKEGRKEERKEERKKGRAMRRVSNGSVSAKGSSRGSMGMNSMNSPKNAFYAL